MRCFSMMADVVSQYLAVHAALTDGMGRGEATSFWRW